MSRRSIGTRRALERALRQPATSRVTLSLSAGELTAILTAAGVTGQSVQTWIRSQLARACCASIDRNPSPFTVRVLSRQVGHA